ncbi:hypothetical protein BURMUCF2_1531 [Burkholderia multivorans CF2]|nr:hypothetical protein BURMUCF2_1531 [Burkholderia multivorans CF2]
MGANAERAARVASAPAVVACAVDAEAHGITARTRNRRGGHNNG